MKHVLIWDLPTRLFHWLLSAGFVAAAVISLTLGDDSPLFPYHAIIGLTIALMVCLRCVWGAIGTRYALFGSFAYGPSAVVEYMKGAIFGGGTRYIGHNPGSAVAIFAMLALVVAMAVTGVMLSQGNEAVKEVHETLAWITVAVVAVHVLGVALHTVRHGENITASMIHGKKSADQADAIASAMPAIAALFLAVSGMWAFGLVRNYDPSKKTTALPIIGTVLHIGEQEDDEGEGGHQDHDEHDDD